MKANIPSILFLDSGVGGFSVYQETRKLLPDYHYLYCFDNGGFPYSEKSAEIITERILAICNKIDQLFPLDIIVVACNTASTVVLPKLRQQFTIPIVGTVPAIKTAAERSQSKHIGLLATKGTVKRSYVDDLIDEFAKDCKIERIGSTKLVEIAEQKLKGNSPDLKAICNELSPWQNIADLDAVVLGCTHFPLIKTEIQSCLPQVKLLVDSGYAIAKRIQYLTENIEPRETMVKKNRIFCTQQSANNVDFVITLQGLGFNQLELINIEN